MTTLTSSQYIQQGLKVITDEFTQIVTPYSFERGRKMWWVKTTPFVLPFIYLYRSGQAYSPINNSLGINIHSGIRVLNDNTQTIVLNGISTTPLLIYNHRYHLRFNAKSGSQYDRCVIDLKRFLVEHVFPWFDIMENPDNLLHHPESPLDSDTKLLLNDALNNHSNLDNNALSLKLLFDKSKRK